MMLRIEKNNLSKYIAKCIVLYNIMLLGSWTCFAVSVTHYMSSELTDKECDSDKKVFEMTAPSHIGCAFVCMNVRHCVAISYDKSQNTCSGCRCVVLRKTINSLSQEVSRLFVREPSSMFNGRCGSVLSVRATVQSATTIGVTQSIRLRSNTSWSPDKEEPYILKITFGFTRRVHSISTIGRNNNGIKEYVTKYELFESDICSWFSTSLVKTMDGNNNSYTLKTNNLKPPISSKCIYLNVIEWNNYPFLRLGLIGY